MWTGRFYDYLARGVPFGPDDGTLAPWAVVASLPFAPEVVIPTIHHMVDTLKAPQDVRLGFKATYNPTFEVEGNLNGWISPWHFGLNQGPIVLMVENYRSGLLWRLLRDCPHLVRGLRRAGFDGGGYSLHHEAAATATISCRRRTPSVTARSSGPKEKRT